MSALPSNKSSIMTVPSAAAKSKFDNVSVRVAHHCEVTTTPPTSTGGSTRMFLLAGELRDPIDFCARVTLKTEVIQGAPSLHLHDDQNKDWIFTGGSLRSQPDIVPTLKPSIADD